MIIKQDAEAFTTAREKHGPDFVEALAWGLNVLQCFAMASTTDRGRMTLCDIARYTKLKSRHGIVITPLAKDELTGPRGEGYRRMIEFVRWAHRAPDEVGTAGALLMGPGGAFITGSDFLMDGGVTASYWFGELAPQ